MRLRRGCLVPVHRDPDEFGSLPRKRRHLGDGALDIGRVGVGHGLHHDRRFTADGHVTDLDGDRPVALRRAGGDRLGQAVGRQGRVHRVTGGKRRSENRSVVAVSTSSCQFDDTGARPEALRAGEVGERGRQRLGHRFVHPTAAFADHEHHEFARSMPEGTGDERVAAFQPMREAILEQEIERPVDGHRSVPLVAGRCQRLDEVVGAGRPCGSRTEPRAPAGGSASCAAGAPRSFHRFGHGRRHPRGAVRAWSQAPGPWEWSWP